MLIMPLSQLPIGTWGIISAAEVCGRLSELGFEKGAAVLPIHVCGGDPRAYFIRGTVIALRNIDAASIVVYTEGSGHIGA